MFWPFLILNPLLEFPSIILPLKGILGVGMRSDWREILEIQVPGDFFPELNPLQDGFSLYKHGAHTTFLGCMPVRERMCLACVQMTGTPGVDLKRHISHPVQNKSHFYGFPGLQMVVFALFPCLAP